MMLMTQGGGGGAQPPGALNALFPQLVGAVRAWICGAAAATRQN